MRRWTYLNGILTVNAVLLTVLVWTQIASTPLLAGSASAQLTIPNAADQRIEIVRAVREVQSSVDDAVRLLQKQTLRVKITNFDDMKQSETREEQEPHRYEGAPAFEPRVKKSNRKPVVQFTRSVETSEEAEWR